MVVLWHSEDKAPAAGKRRPAAAVIVWWSLVAVLALPGVAALGGETGAPAPPLDLPHEPGLPGPLASPDPGLETPAQGDPGAETAEPAPTPPAGTPQEDAGQAGCADCADAAPAAAPTRPAAATTGNPDPEPASGPDTDSGEGDAGERTGSVGLPAEAPAVLKLTAGFVIAALLWRLVTFLGVFRVLTFFGYRVEEGDVTAHPLRRRLLEAARTDPGCTAGVLARRVGADWARAAYHLDVLVRAERLRVVRHGRNRRYMPAGGPRVSADELSLRALARGERPTGKILAFLHRTPGVSTSTIARTFGMAPGHTHYHLDRLITAGLLYKVRQGRRMRHYLTEDGRALLSGRDATPEAAA